jgi:hypothetical protein
MHFANTKASFLLLWWLILVNCVEQTPKLLFFRKEKHSFGLCTKETHNLHLLHSFRISSFAWASSDEDVVVMVYHRLSWWSPSCWLAGEMAKIAVCFLWIHDVSWMYRLRYSSQPNLQILWFRGYGPTICNPTIGAHIRSDLGSGFW